MTVKNVICERGKKECVDVEQNDDDDLARNDYLYEYSYGIRQLDNRLPL